MKIKYKECNCHEDYWEEIIVQNDNHYQNRTVIYYHCQKCSIDYYIEDFFTKEEVFYTENILEI